MVWVDLENLLEIGDGVVVATGVEHLRLLDLVHEAAVAVGVSNDNAGLVGQSVGNDHVVDLFEEDLLSIVHVRLIVSCQVLLHLPLALAVVGHLEVALANVDDVLSKRGVTFPSYSRSTLKTYSSMGSSQRMTS